MKKHLVMIVGKFYPDPSPTGKCAEAYVDLLREQFDISVVCLADIDRKPYEYNGKRVFPSSSGYTIMQHLLAKNKVPAILQNIAKIPVYLLHRFTQPNLLYSYVDAAKKKLEIIHKDRPIDVIFSVGAPMAAHAAAWDFRKRHPLIRWITYTVDSYASQNKGSDKAMLFESTVLAASDMVLLSEEIYENSKIPESLHDKCGILPYLMPPAPMRDSNVRYLNEAKINMVYAGRFYKNLRHPEYLLQLAMELDDSFCLHLYCQSDCDKLINEYVGRSNGKIVRHAPVSVDVIQKIYAEADILVSVGNNTPEFRPSKTFEYIASGKPILNIFYEGFYDEVLARSPMVLQLKRGDPLRDNAFALKEFIQKTQGSFLSRDEVDRYFPSHSRTYIQALLNKVMISH